MPGSSSADWGQRGEPDTHRHGDVRRRDWARARRALPWRRCRTREPRWQRRAARRWACPVPSRLARPLSAAPAAADIVRPRSRPPRASSPWACPAPRTPRSSPPPSRTWTYHQAGAPGPCARASPGRGLGTRARGRRGG
eukprot:scaffold71637_cov59-Phaeocystis_antarctica.AAC.3